MSKILLKDKRVLKEYNRTVDIIPFVLSDEDYFDGIYEPNYNLTKWEREKKTKLWERIVAKVKTLGYKTVIVDFRTMKICAEFA